MCCLTFQCVTLITGIVSSYHGSPAGEVEAPELVDPARGVPGPAGDGVVDEGCPDEHEDHAGEHAAALTDGSDG